MPNFLRGSGNTQTTYTSGPIGVPSPVTVTFNSLQDSSGSAISVNLINSQQ